MFHFKERMKMIEYRSSFFAVILFAALAIGISSCSEDDVVTPPADHFAAEGVRLKTSGITMAEIFQGATNDTLQANVDSLSDAFDVYFLDKNKAQLDPPADTDKKFKAVIDDNTIVEFWQHEGEEGGYEFHLRGLKPGATFIEFFIEHAGHNDYRSGKMPVKVTP